MSVSRELPAWPALASDEALPLQLTCHRAVWGKVHGAASDYRWIAASPSLAPRIAGLEGELSLGAEDLPRRSSLWRSIGDLHWAVNCYQSRAIDKQERSGFLEKQVLEWRRQEEVPALLGALLLLPAVSQLTDEIWWERRSDSRFLENDFILELTAEDCRPVPVVHGDLATAISTGIDMLEQRLTEEDLGRIYASLLAGRRAISLTGPGQPLPPQVLAALLLPLPRSLADRLSIAGWLPSSRVDAEALAGRWDVVVTDQKLQVPATGPEPTPEQQRSASRLVEALLDRKPALLDRLSLPGFEPSKRSRAPVRLALWGPSAAGKTVLLAQLYLYMKRCEGPNDWEVFPTEQSLAFIKQMREMMLRENLFPKATVTGIPERVVYQFSKPTTGDKASLLVEDRAGSEYEKLNAQAQERLRSADGLVLIFDPTRDRTSLEIEISQTLEDVHVQSGRDGERDDRPIAVCISKADTLITTPADLQRATDDPDGFVRTHEKIAPILFAVLERFCSTVKFFPVSAAGIHLHHGVVEPTVFYDESMTPRIARSGEPFNLMAPFAWVLDQITGAGS